MSIFRGLAVAAVALSSLHAAWGALARGPSQPLDWRAARVAKGTGIEMLYPAGWNATSNDGRDVIVASFPISKRWFASERKSLPARGIYIWAFSYGRLPHLGGPPFPPRPARLKLDRKKFGYYECGFNLDGYDLVFRDHGLVVQVMVALGPQADSRAALAVINRLRVA